MTSSRSRRSFVFGLIVLAFVLLIPYPALAQQTSAIAGVVRDTSGAVLPGVTVEAASPVLITVLGVVLHRLGAAGERVTAMHWAGTLLSLAGIYLVVRSGGKTTGQSLAGDVMMGFAVVCWSIYTIAARPLMERHSPVGVRRTRAPCHNRAPRSSVRRFQKRSARCSHRP